MMWLIKTLMVWELTMPINFKKVSLDDRLGVNLKPDMIRQDLTMKSNQGYLGQVKDNQGRKMTEQSIDVDLDLFGEKKKYHMPLLVPGLTNEEIASIREDKPLDSAYKKAVEHGKQRLLKGKDPFFQDGEVTSEKYFFTDDRDIVLESDEVPIVANQTSKDVQIDNNDKFYSLVKTLENSVKAGFDKETNTWKPHTSLEGGRPTIAWGHKLTPEEAKGNYVMVGDTKVSLDTGLTNEQADMLFKQDMDIAKTEAKKFIGEDFDKLSNKQQLLATELFYNLGANKAKQYTNFKEKLLAGDESFINEIDRGYKDAEGNRQLLTDRTDPLKEWYVSD
jgi:hypothetical protein